MIRHLCRKNKCVKNLTAYRYNDDELYNLSLNIVKENSNSLIFNNICQYCNKNFSTRGNLKKHLKKHEDGSIPIIDELNNDEDIKLEENNNNFQNENKETSLNQTINNITVNQQFNNYNIINVKYPNSFDKDWDLSQLSYEKKLFLISCCNTKYSELLKYILQNDDNLNVIIENETNTGIVYKNDIEKYIHLNKSDIIDQSLTKLNQQLNNLCKEISIKNDTESQERLEYESLSINKKFNDYKVNNNNIKNGVEDIISNIFNEKKDKAINMMNKIIEYETKDNLIENNGF
tara:strand:+ start:6480 stop:7349 length:870 start_codon:yes stop_codon:yes gene_type:complete